MKTILLYTLILFSTKSFSQTNLEILCDYSFDDRIVNLMEEKNPHCEANVIWGNKDVCFVGAAEDLADYFNAGKFAKHNKGLRINDAYVTENGTVIYKGTDARNYYTKKSEISHCK